jgi:hypothetical protein
VQPNPTDRTALREKDDLGLSIDMLDVDRLRQAASQCVFEVQPEVRPGIVGEWLSNLADRVEQAVRDIGVLRLAALPDSIDCPLCGQLVRQVSSATLSLALWQHFNWCHTLAAPPEGRETPRRFDYVSALKGARAHVEASVLYRRFINHTPLENDIAVWMTDFAAQYAESSPPLPVEGTENVLSSPMAAALLVKLKEECEAQHARAEEAEAMIRAYQAALDAYRTDFDDSGMAGRRHSGALDALDRWQR